MVCTVRSVLSKWVKTAATVTKGKSQRATIRFCALKLFSNKLISWGPFVQALHMLFNLNHEALAGPLGSGFMWGVQAEGHVLCTVKLKQQIAALSEAVTRPLSNPGTQHWSPFKCIRTFHSALQMFTLARCYMTKKKIKHRKKCWLCAAP